jgi:mevalonate kinase
MGVVASAPAKVILFGEHFVVYGEPAIVLAIDRRVYATVDRRTDKKIRVESANMGFSGCFENGRFTVEKGEPQEAGLKFEAIKMAAEKIMKMQGEIVGLDIDINSSIPVGAGLGSSAAVISAVTLATGSLLGAKMSKEDVFRITCETEKYVHGTTSGVDPAISTFGGILLFQMDTGFKPVETKIDIPLVVGDTGVERSTRVQVERVRSMMENHPSVFKLIQQTAKEIVLRAMDALQENDLPTLGELMNINHALLYGMGVSDESLEWLINASRRAGALGAKLTGAGGGGCMVALARNESTEKILDAITGAGGRPFKAKKTDEGVKIEQG